jgi:cytochrome c oxidase assembly protein subunit 11
MTGKPKNSRTLWMLVLLVVFMGGLAYAAVPLYSLFCKATGFGGTVQRVDENPQESAPVPAPKSTVHERYIIVHFDGNVNSNLPWDFAPDVQDIRVKPGDTVTVNYHATNRSNKAMTGIATYNVQPDKAGQYFNKIQCFCFTNQTLKPHETATLPVQFFIDPLINLDPDSKDVSTITLSYTFFLAKDQDKKAKGDAPASSPNL